MDWIDGNSSTVLRFLYDKEGQVLSVEFAKGGTYDYFDVPEHIFEEMRSAGSRGQFLAQRIKGAYRYAKA